MKTSRAEEIRAYILEHVDENPAGIATQTAKKFRISRPGVHRHISALLEDGKLAKIGHRRRTRYARTTERQQVWALDTNDVESAADVWASTCARKLRVFKANVADMLQWGFCQVLQNTLDHAGGSEVAIFYEFSGKSIHLSILDEGIGIFEHICQNHQISDHREAALLLMQGAGGRPGFGKGLLWCSKLYDSLLVRANGLEFCRFGIDDWYLDNAPADQHHGTLVQLSLDIATTKTLATVLRPGGHSPADQTHVFVKMLELEQEIYLTRADAKKLLFDLEGFKEIVLDFKSVRNVGHHFVNEIFHVFKQSNPQVEISYVNANANIKFMIEKCGPVRNQES